MISANCMFETRCTEHRLPGTACPYKRPDMYQMLNLLQVKCDIWLTNRPTEKERRQQYAQEKRLGNEDERSRKQA